MDAVGSWPVARAAPTQEFVPVKFAVCLVCLDLPGTTHTCILTSSGIAGIYRLAGSSGKGGTRREGATRAEHGVPDRDGLNSEASLKVQFPIRLPSQPRA